MRLMPLQVITMPIHIQVITIKKLRCMRHAMSAASDSHPALSRNRIEKPHPFRKKSGRGAVSLS